MVPERVEDCSPLAYAPKGFCVALRISALGFVEFLRATASAPRKVGGVLKFVSSSASLVLVDFGAALGRGLSGVELCDLHGVPDFAETLVTAQFERLDQCALGRVLFLQWSELPVEAAGMDLDLALVRRVAELQRADAIFVRWPPPAPAPERWCRLMSAVALTLMRDEPAFLYHLTSQPWPDPPEAE